MPDIETKTCAVCKADIEGFAFDADVFDRLTREEMSQVRAYQAGYECSACGDAICPVCKAEHVGASDLTGSCPRCGNPWAPKRVFLRPYVERANREIFRKLLKAEEKLSRGATVWPGVIQIVIGILLLAFGIATISRAADAPAGPDRSLLKGGLFWLLLGVGLILNGLPTFRPGAPTVRWLCGVGLMAVGVALPTLGFFIYPLSDLIGSRLVAVVALTAALCTAGARHIIAARRLHASSLAVRR